MHDRLTAVVMLLSSVFSQGLPIAPTAGLAFEF